LLNNPRHLIKSIPICHKPFLILSLIKLLEKTAEGRYQSTWGIKADLDSFQLQFAKTGKITTFTIAPQENFDFINAYLSRMDLLLLNIKVLLINILAMPLWLGFPPVLMKL